MWRDFGGRVKFSGVVSTVKCHEDNSVVKAALESPGAGRVLVVDGAGSLRRALVGGNIGAAAAKNGWAGMVIDGCVRDVAELAACDVGIRALAAMPLPTDRRGEGQRDVPVQIQGVWIRPGDRALLQTPTASSSWRQPSADATPIARPGARLLRAARRTLGYFFAGSTARATASTKVAWIWSPTLISLNWPASGTLSSTVCFGPLKRDRLRLGIERDHVGGDFDLAARPRRRGRSPAGARTAAGVSVMLRSSLPSFLSVSVRAST